MFPWRLVPILGKASECDVIACTAQSSNTGSYRPSRRLHKIPISIFSLFPSRYFSWAVLRHFQQPCYFHFFSMDVPYWPTACSLLQCTLYHIHQNSGPQTWIWARKVVLWWMCTTVQWESATVQIFCPRFSLSDLSLCYNLEIFSGSSFISWCNTLKIPLIQWGLSVSWLYLEVQLITSDDPQHEDLTHKSILLTVQIWGPWISQKCNGAKDFDTVI